MSKYLGLFVSESTEHLEALGRDLLQLERSAQPGAIDSLFRHAHSVKGMSASMGLENMAVLAHRMEDVLGYIRTKPERVTRELIDLLLSSSDTLLEQVKNVAQGRAEGDESVLVGKLTEAVVGLLGESPSPTRVAAATFSLQSTPRSDDPNRTVKVKTELLDEFIESVGELLLATAKIREVGKGLPGQLQSKLDEETGRLHTLVKGFHDKVMAVRMTPLRVITDRLPRVVRDVAQHRGIDVELVIIGAETELDRSVLDELAEPLIHLVRNGIDHGLESTEARREANKPPKGKLSISARRDRDRVILEVEDDGQGMNPIRLKEEAVARGLLSAGRADHLSESDVLMLACLPGVSTAQNVSEISGRGVGMDAVKRAIDQIGGSLEIESQPGKGTRFTLKLPQAVAVVRLLLVQLGEETVGLPIQTVLGALEVEKAGSSVVYNNAWLPARSLAQLLGFPPSPTSTALQPYVVVDLGSGSIALGVDKILGQEEVVVKPLLQPLDRVHGLAGVTILGNGRPVFILDIPRLGSA